MRASWYEFIGEKTVRNKYGQGRSTGQALSLVCVNFALFYL